jgi:transposase-like protein
MTQPIPRDAIYRRRVFDAEIIELCVRWYISYRLSYRDLVEMMAERGVQVAHTTILRWVLQYVPEYEKRWGRFARPVGTSWRVDETYVSIRGRWHHLYRASRSVHIAGITPHPDSRWMTQVARNLTDTESGFLRGPRYLIPDRDTKYSAQFRNALDREGIHLIRLPPRSPNLNAFAERFVRSIKTECLNRMIFFGQDSLRHAVREFMAHYHAERNHQGLENRLVRPAPVTTPSQPLHRCQRLGGMLKFVPFSASLSHSSKPSFASAQKLPPTPRCRRKNSTVRRCESIAVSCLARTCPSPA